MAGFWLPGDKWPPVPKPIGFPKPEQPKPAPKQPVANAQSKSVQH